MGKAIFFLEDRVHFCERVSVARIFAQANVEQMFLFFQEKEVVTAMELSEHAFVNFNVVRRRAEHAFYFRQIAGTVFYGNGFDDLSIFMAGCLE